MVNDMLPALLGTAFAAFIVERDRRSLVAALATLGIAAVVSVFV